MNRITEAFADGPAFIPYLTAGDPDYTSSKGHFEALARGGADILELGLPFSEPIAEGPTIQGAVARSLEGGMTPDRYLEFAAELEVGVPLVCMTYYNIIYRYGDEPVNSFVAAAAANGISGIIVPDLPVEESEPLQEACEQAGLDLIFIVAPTTTRDRLPQIMDQVSGFVYVQARLGTTGARSTVSDRTRESLARLRGYDIPKAVGFGISTGGQAEQIIRAGADGVIVGSALVDVVSSGIEDGEPQSVVSDQLESLARSLKDGALAGLAGQESQHK